METNLTLDDFTPRADLLPGRFTTEASDLGIRAGQWPEEIIISVPNKYRTSYVERVHLKPINTVVEDGELISVDYDSCGVGMINLRVYND